MWGYGHTHDDAARAMCGRFDHQWHLLLEWYACHVLKLQLAHAMQVLHAMALRLHAAHHSLTFMPSQLQETGITTAMTHLLLHVQQAFQFLDVFQVVLPNLLVAYAPCGCTCM